MICTDKMKKLEKKKKVTYVVDTESQQQERTSLGYIYYMKVEMILFDLG